MKITAAVMIGLCGGLRGENILLTYIMDMIKFLEENSIQHRMGHVVVTLQGGFKIETGDKCHMFLLVYMN